MYKRYTIGMMSWNGFFQLENIETTDVQCREISKFLTSRNLAWMLSNDRKDLLNTCPVKCVNNVTILWIILKTS